MRLHTQGFSLHFDPNGFAKRLSMALAADDRSQQDLELLAGISQGQLSRWKTGKVVPDLPYVVELVVELGVSADWLLLGRGPMRPEDPQAEVTAFREVAEIVARVTRREQ